MRRREEYEDQLRQDPLMYDTWFDYCKLEENAAIDGSKTASPATASANANRVRELYERAVANIPPAAEKRFWQRYIYLWIRYALFEEIDQQDINRARDVYTSCLKLVPHETFSFSKIWILAAKLELRCKDVSAARKILGNAIGKAPKEKIFKYYIEMEMQMGNVDRCRTLYERYLEWNSASSRAWVQFTELEHSLGELDRCRAIFELAVEQEQPLDMPEAVWKAYIDFEISEGERKRARDLYERLLTRTQHVKVWMSFAQFEAATMTRPLRDDEIDDDNEMDEARRRVPLADEDETESAGNRSERARNVYERGCRTLRESSMLEEKEACVMLLEAWRAFEKSTGSIERLREVEKKMPQRVKRKRAIVPEGELYDKEYDDGNTNYEEYYDYIFPDEAGSQAPNLKLLEMAYKWKRQKQHHPDPPLDQKEDEKGGGQQQDANHMENGNAEEIQTEIE